MKYTFVVSALLYGSQAMRMESEYPGYYSYMQEGDMGLNQRKLYAMTLKQTGANVQLYDTNKSQAQNDLEVEELDAHLNLLIAKNNLDIPEDRTHSVIKPSSDREVENEHWLIQKKKAKSFVQLSKSSLDDPVEDRSVTVVSPNSVQEEGMVIWLVQNKKVSQLGQSPHSQGFVQMDDELTYSSPQWVTEYAAVAEDDDEGDHAQFAQQSQDETPNPTFFSQSYAQEEVNKPEEEVGQEQQQQAAQEFDEFGDKKKEAMAEAPPKLELIPKKEVVQAPPKPVEQPKPQRQAEENEQFPNLGQLNIDRAFGVMNRGQFDNEWYGDGEY